MSLRTPIIALWISLATALAGCAPSQPPLPSITEVASAPFPAARPEIPLKAPEALDAIYIDPEGAQLDAVQALTVTFNQPVIALDTLGGLAQLNPLRLEPEVAGRVEWIGAHTLRFTPDAPWPAATPFTAWLTEGLEGVSGRRLDEELVWTFSTPRPRILSVEPGRAERRADRRGPIVLRFNQPIDLSTLRERLALTAAQKPVSFDLRVQGEAGEGVILVIPSGPLPMGVRVEVTLQAGIRGVEGLLPGATTFRHAFETHGPLQVIDSGCVGGRYCGVEGEFAFVFSNPLAPGAAEHVQITPEPPARGGPLVRVEGDTLRISGALQPDERYKVDIDQGLKDTFGQALERPFTRIFRAGDYAPSMALDARDAVLDPGQKVIAAQFVNVTRAKLSLARVDEASLADAWRLSRGEPVEASGALARVKTRAITTGARPNEPTDLDLPLELESGVGLVSLEASVRGARWEPYDLKAASLVQKTELGLQVWTDYDQMLVWLTRMSDAEPLAGRRVALRGDSGALLWEGMTDDKGVVIAPGLNRLDAPPPFFIIAGQGEDFAFRRIEGRSAVHDRWLKGYRQTRYARTPQRLVGQLLTDRGLYRPGDTVHVEGALRLEDRGGLQMLPPGARKIAVTVFNPMGRQTLSALTTLSPQGAFHVPVPIDAVGDVVAEGDRRLDGTSHLGAWRVEAAPVGLPGVAPQALSASFLVERHRATASFEVTAEIQRQHHLPGGTLEALVRAEHAFGAPLQGASLSWTLRASPGLFEPEGHRGFNFSPLWTSARPPETALLSGAARLDEGGQVTLSIPLDRSLGDRTRTLRLDVEIADELGQLSAASAAALLHPAAAYFGVGLDHTRPTQGQRFEARIIAARPHGQRADDLRAKVTLERARRVQIDGAPAAVTSWEEIDGCEITTLDEPRVCAFAPRHPGRHRLKVTGADEYGNPMSAAQALLVQPQGPSAAEPRDDLEITLDRDTARVGQTARLLIQAPFKGRAMLTLARLGLIEHRDLGVIGPEATIDLPVTDRSAPNLEIALAIIKGNGPDGPPAVAFDSTSLRVELDRPLIDVRVLPDRQIVAPGAEATFALRTADAEGRPLAAEVSVAVIDEAALALASQSNPDPLGAFWAPRDAELAALDLRQSVVNDRARAPLASVRERGAPLRDPWAPSAPRDPQDPDAPLPALLSPAAHPANPIIFHDAALSTDDTGTLKIKIKTPTAPGTSWRVVAQARAEGHRFGAGLGAISLEGPLGVEIVAPAFARVGDRLTTQALVRNPTDATLDVLIALEAPDLTTLSPDGPSQQRLTIPPRARRAAAFQWRATRPGQASIALRASASGEPALTQLARAQLTVIDPAWTDRRAALGVATGALSQPFNLPDGLHPEVGGLEVTFGSSPVALQELADQLLRLPPVGLDNAAARLIAALTLTNPQLQRQSAPSTPPDALIKDSLDRVLALQRRDGGFSPWLERPSTTRATAFALIALRMARERGVSVPDYAINAALDRAEEALHKRTEPGTGAPLNPAELAFTAAALADLDPGRVRLELDLDPLASQLDALPAYARACVAMATRARLKGDALPPQAARVLDALTADATPDAAFKEPESAQIILPHPLHSNLRTAAIVLYALHRLAPNHPLAPRLTEHLLKATASGLRLNPHELAFALMAMDNAPPSNPAPATSLRLWVGQRYAFEATLDAASPAARRTFIPMSDLLKGRNDELVIAAIGAPVHYRVSLQSLPSDLRQIPVDRGIALTRDHVDLFGAPIDRAVAGQIVLARLTVAVADPISAAIVDLPLAAGTTPLGPLSAHNGAPGLHPAPLVEHAEHQGDRIFLLLRDLKPGVYEHTLTLRATLPGEFTLPPTTARDHARPERFGQSPVTRLTILPHPTTP